MSTRKPQKKAPAAWVLPDVAEACKDYDLISACLSGERAVKSLGTLVLPMPNAEDQSAANRQRYAAYQERAVFYNVTGRTLEGMVGFVFVKDPVAEIPEEIKPMLTNVDGSGVTLVQQAKETLRFTLGFGRAGLLVDFPSLGEPVSKSQVTSGEVQPTITLYHPQDVINYRVIVEQGKTLLSLLVLREQLMEPEDDFVSKSVTHFRIYRRSTSGVTVEIHDGDGNVVQSATPVNGRDGTPILDVPFFFVGAVNNDSSIDPPPLLPLATLNLGHFRNSADFEEAAYLVGQPTPVFAGLTREWVDEVMDKKIRLGSRGGVLLPVGGTGQLLQAQPNSLPKEGMELKEKQMVAIGAKLVEQRHVQRTATEAGQQHASEASVLVSCANNVCTAYTAALRMASSFVTEKAPDAITFELAESLTRETLDAQQAVSLVELMLKGVLGYTEVRWRLRSAGIAFEDDKEVQKEGEKRLADQNEKELALSKSQADTRKSAANPKAKT